MPWQGRDKHGAGSRLVPLIKAISPLGLPSAAIADAVMVTVIPDQRQTSAWEGTSCDGLRSFPGEQIPSMARVLAGQAVVSPGTSRSQYGE